jgi:CheY-like chemotaxis protein
METEHRTLRVLVVEDDDDTAASYAILLRLYGYEIEVAADGPTALRAVSTLGCRRWMAGRSPSKSAS